MFFRLKSVYRGSGAQIDLRSDPVQFLVPPRNIVVSIRQPTEQEAEELNGARATAPRVEARLEVNPSDEKTEAAYRALADGRLPDDSPPRDKWPRDFEFITNDLRIKPNYMAPPSVLSAEVQEFNLQQVRDMREATHNALTAMRWRLGLFGPHKPVTFGQQQFSIDGENWHAFSLGGTVRISSRSVPPLTRYESQIQDLLDADAREPLAHALWHEAFEQRGTSPRSAILIGIAALEVGIKQYAIACVPGAAWLLEEAPAPPILRMLTEFLPNLTPPESGARFEAPDEATMGTIRKGVRIRNEVTHKGVTQVKPDTVREVLSAIRRLLWRLDAAAGADWGRHHEHEQLPY
jgi:hypothetical protein